MKKELTGDIDNRRDALIRKCTRKPFLLSHYQGSQIINEELYRGPKYKNIDCTRK